MKSAFSITLSTLILASAAEGANIIANSLANSGADLAKQVVSSEGANLPEGSLVRVGYFDTSRGDVADLTGNDFSAIDIMFVALGEDATWDADGTTGPIRINATGQFGGSIQNVANSYAPQDRELYLWVLNIPNPSTAGPDTQWEWAIFRDASWVVPNDIGSINLVTWQINEADEVIKGTLDLGNNQIRLAVIPEAVIPEPGMAAFCLAATSCLLRRRK